MPSFDTACFYNASPKLAFTAYIESGTSQVCDMYLITEFFFHGCLSSIDSAVITLRAM